MSPLRAGNVHPKFAAARRSLTRWGRDAAHSHSAVCTRASTAQHEPRGKARVVPFSIFPSSLFCCMDTFVAPTRPLSPRGVVDDCTAVVAIACAGSLGVCLCSVLQVVRRVPFFPFSIPSPPILQVGGLVLVCKYRSRGRKYLPLLWISAGATCPVVNFPLPHLRLTIDDTTKNWHPAFPSPESRTSQIAS